MLERLYGMTEAEKAWTKRHNSRNIPNVNVSKEPNSGGKAKGIESQARSRNVINANLTNGVNDEENIQSTAQNCEKGNQEENRTQSKSMNWNMTTVEWKKGRKIRTEGTESNNK